MGTSKVSLFGNTLIDLRDVTVTSDHLVGGQAHDKYGDIIEGEARPYANEKAVLNHTYAGTYENNQLETFGNRSFINCTTVTSVKALNATSIGYAAFRACTNLLTIDAPNATSVGGYGCEGASKLTTVDLPSVTTIGDYSFQNCSALTTVNMPSLTAIPESGFNTCRKLKTLNAPNVTSIGHAGLQYCGLTELRSTKLQGISGYGMRGSGSLTTVYIPNATWISEQGLASCGKIASAYWPRVSSIGAYQFNSVNVILPLRKVAYPSLKSIPSDGFHNSYGMLAFDFGTQMANVGQRGFQNSPHLTALIFRRKDSVPTLVNVNAFDTTPFKSGGTGATIYIPKVLYDHLGDGTALDYQSATNWSTIYARGTITWAQIEGSEYEHYYADGVPCSDIYWTLTNTTLSSSKIFVDYEQPYTVTVQPDIGYEVSSISIKIGGVDITQDVYNSSTHIISIPSVTDYVRIEVVSSVIQYDWDLEWDYTDGLLIDNGWIQGNWNTGGVATMTEEGLKLTSANNSSISFRRTDYLVTKGVMEVVLSETFNTSTAYVNGAVCISNGTNGIAFISPKGQAAIRDVSTLANCKTIGYAIPSGTDFTLRLALDGTSGNISINGNIIWRTSDVPGITYGTWCQTTRVHSESQQSGYSTIIKSIKIKNLEEE